MVMEHIKIAGAGSKGDGIFARHALSSSDILHTINEPLIAAINTTHLSEFCYNCYAGSKPSTEQCYNMGQYRDAELKVCTGCRVAYFCAKQCQTEAWKRGHKHECRVFGKLQPRILPAQVRAVVTILLRYKHGILREGSWQQVLASRSHLDDHRARGGHQWFNLKLMAKAAHEYAETKVDLDTVLKLLCILKLNGMALTTTYGDPIGVFIDLTLIKLNHSCEGNVIVHRPTYTNGTGWIHHRKTDQALFKLLPLREIAEDEELTTSYTEFTEHVIARQKTLKENYFFTCACLKCERDFEADRVLAASDPILSKLRQNWREQANAQRNILRAPPFNIQSAISNFTSIISAMESQASFTPDTDPYHFVVHELRLLYMNYPQACDQALICALKEYLLIDPAIHTSLHYPTRIVNAIFLLQILALLDDTFDQPSPHGPHITEQRLEIERMGLSRTSWKYWRLRIAVDTRACLLNTGMTDMAECLQMEQFMIGINGKPESQDLLRNASRKRLAEDEMRRVIGLNEDRWNSFVKPELEKLAARPSSL